MGLSVNKEEINQLDDQGQKHGTWKFDELLYGQFTREIDYEHGNVLEDRRYAVNLVPNYRVIDTIISYPFSPRIDVFRIKEFYTEGEFDLYYAEFNSLNAEGEELVFTKE